MNEPLEEAQRIYAAIFRRPIPPAVCAQFLRVPEHVFPPLTEEMRSGYQRILAEVKDLEALEFASRVRQRNLLLTLKFRLMVYLAECHPPTRSDFVNDRERGLLRVAGLLVPEFVRCGIKWLKGQYLLRHYNGP